MEIKLSDSALEAKYYYTDIIIIVAFYLSIIYRTRQVSQNAAERVYKDLHVGVSHEMVSLPRGCFLSTANPEQVLALAGFHNNLSTCCWINNLLMYSAFKFSNGKYPIDMPEHKMKAIIADEIRKCTDDNVKFALSD